MHTTEVKVVLASVATALAVYQLVLAAIGYRRLRLIEAAPAFAAERELQEERLEQQEDRREDREDP